MKTNNEPRAAGEAAQIPPALEVVSNTFTPDGATGTQIEWLVVPVGQWDHANQTGPILAACSRHEKAAAIVRACNSHAALVAALQLAHSQIQALRDIQRSGITLPDIQAGISAAIFKATA